jgi:hypothetical protein
MFTAADLKQITERGSDASVILQQIENFKKGFPFADLHRPATSGDGLLMLSDADIEQMVDYYNPHAKDYTIIKFVPASGAASRMFQNLFNFLDDQKGNVSLTELMNTDKSFNSVYTFISKIREFAFYNDLHNTLLQNGLNLEKSINQGEFHQVIDFLLNEKGLGYGKLPKGLLKFHKYSDKNRIAFEEHIVEAVNYGRSGNHVANIHFTVSPEHLKRFQEEVNKVLKTYEMQFGIRLNISFSVQKSSTDTIAVDLDNEPFRENNQLVFRPGGHGAIIENLNDLDGDLIFIKNIDNVVPDRLKEPTTKYKKAIGGLLLKIQSETFSYLREMENDISAERLDQIAELAKSDLNLNIPNGFPGYNARQKQEFLYRHLNRPIRVCGMVKNEGEPGGGPFWVKNSKGEVSLQIVESSQVDNNNPSQMDILRSSTHFNPVDLVCGIKDYKGKPFDLRQYVVPETGFISIKSKDGKKLKAQELPGLWNGAMADWITLFVEVPVITFNPVKTVNDLLRPQHQAS